MLPFFWEIYEEVWNVGTLLQSNDVVTHILAEGYSPWPKVKAGTTISDEFYEVHDRHKQVTSSPTRHTNHSPNAL